MPKALRMLDAVLVVLAEWFLAAAYSRLGYAPIATHFMLQSVFSFIGGIAGCYLVSRWTIPDVLTGFLLIMSTTIMLWMTSSIWLHKKYWTRDMYARSLRMAESRFRERRFERLMSILGIVFCLGWTASALAHGDVTGVAMFTGLAALSISAAVNEYLRSAPPPEPKG
jgi:small-conductance mechanosensitive channel